MTKNCFRCGTRKPLEAFYRHPKMRDGHLNKCIECCRAYARARAAANPGLDTRPWRHPGVKKLRAHNRARVLPSEPCEMCGAEKAEKHHPDYDQPLLVRYLCKACHGREHQRYAKSDPLSEMLFEEVA